MERQSTRKLFKVVIALVSLLLLCMSAFMLTSCGDEHVHEYTATVTQEAKCGVDGVKTFTCSCGETYTEAIPATAAAHTFVNHYCSVCGESEYFDSSSIEIPEGHSHSFTEVVASFAATCTTPGFTVEACTCGVTHIKSGSYVAASGHAWSAEPTSSSTATCAKDGIAIYTCSTCGITKEEITPATGEHDYVLDEDAKGAKEATCTDMGVAVYACATCGGVYTATTAALGHEAGEAVVTTKATCTTEGVSTVSCTRCDVVLETSVIPATGHSYNVVTTKATCTAEGSYVITCANCEDVNVTVTPANYAENAELIAAVEAANETTLSLDAIAVLGHTIVLPSDEAFPADVDATEHVTAATCVANRTEQQYCTTCGQWLEWVEIENSIVATAHQLGDEQYLLRPTPDTAGYYYQICELCGAQVKVADSDIAALGNGHNWAEVVVATVEGTCTTDATQTTRFYCQDPTCMGITFIDPSDTDRTNVDNYDPEGVWYDVTTVTTKAPGHTWNTTKIDGVTYELDADGWAVTKVATCTEKGEKVRICSVCGEKEVAEIAMLAHTYGDKVEITKTTCTENGSYSVECEVCGNTVVYYASEDLFPAEAPEGTVYAVDATLKATGHDYKITESVYTRTNDTHTVVNTYVCQNCGEKYTETLKEQEHVFTETTNATCDDSGLIMYLCECGYAEYDEHSYVPALGHLYTNIVSVSGDCLTATMITYSCERCNDTYAVVLQSPVGHVWVKVDKVDETCTTEGSAQFFYCSTCGAVVISDAADEKAVNKYLDSSNYVKKEDGTAYNYNNAEDRAAIFKDPEILIPATGHSFVEYPLIATSCTEYGATILVCETCGVETADGVTTFTFMKDAEGYVASGDAYAQTNFDGATDEQIAAILAAVNASIAADAEKITENDLRTYVSGYNFTAIKFVAELGHNYVPGTDTDAKCVKSATLTAEYEAALATGVIVDYPEAAAQFGIYAKCDRCGAYQAAVDHEYHYYKYAADENGDATSKYEAADGSAVESIADAKAYTLEEVMALEDGAYLTKAGTPNCWFIEVCVNYDACGSMLANAQHEWPEADDIANSANCQHGDLCVVCGKELSIRIGHSLSTLAAIEANGDDAKAMVEALKAAYEWANTTDVAPDCTTAGTEYTVSVCYGCLEAWYKLDAEGREAFNWFTNAEDETDTNNNYTVVATEVPALGHSYEIDPTDKTTKQFYYYTRNGQYVEVEDASSASCLDGWFYIDYCTVCGAVRVDTENSDETLATDEQGHYNVTEPKNHTFAPIANYWQSATYIPATAAHSAQMSYICVFCGETAQGYYGMMENCFYATDEQIAAYDGSFGAVTQVRAEDANAIVTISGDNAAADLLAVLSNTEEYGAYVSVVLATNVTLDEVIVFASAETVLDLGGGTLTFSDKVTSSIVLADDQILTISNGKIDYQAALVDTTGYGTVSAINTKGASYVELNGVVITSNSTVLFVGDTNASATSELVVKNSSITTSGVYGISTNASVGATQNVSITIEDSTIVATGARDGDSVAVLMNVAGNLSIKNSMIKGERQGVVVRGGTAVIEDTTIELLATYTGTSYYTTGNWSSGTELPYAAIVAGNRSTAYQYATDLTLTNVTVTVPENATNAAKLYVWGNAVNEEAPIGATVAINGTTNIVEADIAGDVYGEISDVSVSINGVKLVKVAEGA